MRPVAVPIRPPSPVDPPPEVEPADGLSRRAAIGAAMIEAIAYADVFDWPLTASEVHRDLPLAARPDEVDAELVAAVLGGRLSFVEGHATLAGRESLVPRRADREASSIRLRSRAAPWLRAIGRLPFVRLVAVSGSLAVSAATDDADVDLFVVVDDGRLWLARAMTIALVRVARAAGIDLCPNYFVARSAIARTGRACGFVRSWRGAPTAFGRKSYTH
jgi:hypothetical protein